LVVVGSPRRRLAPRPLIARRPCELHRRLVAGPEQPNADQLAFWNGPGGHTWVARQEDTDITLVPVSEASPSRTRRAASGCWTSAAAVVRVHVGICARRRSRGPRGGAGHLRADVG